MADQLCALWKVLAEHPEDAQAAAAARARLVDLLGHVDDCAECQRVSESMRQPELVFEALGGAAGAINDDELATLDRAERLLAESTTDIAAAIPMLLAELPDHIVAPAVEPLPMFLAMDAVNLLARSCIARGSGDDGELSAAGLRVDGVLVASRQQLVAEIARHANVSAEAADELWNWQLAACQATEHLYRGLDALALNDGTIALTVVPSTPSEGLAQRWVNPVEEDQPSFELKNLVPEMVFYAVKDVYQILGNGAPVVEHAALTFDKAGHHEIGQLLIEQSRNHLKERDDLVVVIEQVKKSLPSYARVKPAVPAKRPLGRFQAVSFGKIKMRREPVEALKYARKLIVEKKDGYQVIVNDAGPAKVDLSPIKTFAAKGIKSADLQIRMIDDVVLKLGRV